MKLGYCPIGNGSSIKPFDKVFAEKQDLSTGTGYRDVHCVHTKKGKYLAHPRTPRHPLP